MATCPEPRAAATSTRVPSAAELLAGPPYDALSAALGGSQRVVGVEAAALGGGLANQLTRVAATLEGGAPASTPRVLHLALKAHHEATLTRCAALGTAREAHFYLHLAPRLAALLPQGALPRCWFAAGDMATGRKALLLELAEGGVDSGLVFGGGSPLNWPRAQAVLAAAALATPEGAAASAFRLAALLHGAHWRDGALVAQRWLRGADWYRPPGGEVPGGGEGEAQFAAAQAQVAAAWGASLAGEGPSGSVQWRAEWPELTALVTASHARVSWTSWRARCLSTPFTLVHGDFHPGNALLLAGAGASAGTGGGAGAGGADLRTMLLDWEAVGLGSGPQDLGQYVISHMEPAVRAGCEQRLLRAYADDVRRAVAASGRGDAAAAAAAADLAWPAVWAEYVAGGVERWVWLLSMLAGLCPPDMTRFWAAQLHAFARDHGVTPASVGQPRV